MGKKLIAILISILVFGITGCTQSASGKTVLPILEGVPVYENTNWGMDEKTVLEILEISDDDYVMTVFSDRGIRYTVENAEWLGKDASVQLTFDNAKLSNGEKIGLAAVFITLKDSQISLETVGQIFEEEYGLKDKLTYQKKETGNSFSYGLSASELESCVPYLEEVEVQLEDMGFTAKTVLWIEATQKEGGPVTIGMSSKSAGVYTKVAAGLDSRRPISEEKENAKENPELEEILTFENTCWGMSEKEVFDALGMKQEDFQLEVSGEDVAEKYKIYKLENFQWQGIPVLLQLQFNPETLSEGETVGFSKVFLSIQPNEASVHEVKEKLTAVYNLQPKELEAGTNIFGNSMMSALWTTPIHNLASHKPYRNEVRSELETISSNVTVAVSVEVSQPEGENSIVSIDGTAEAVYYHVASRYQ